MLRILLLITILTFVSSCDLPQQSSPSVNVAAGRIERIADFSSQYVSPRHVDIWLPEAYDLSNNYPVLYMHDGQMLFDSSITWNHQEWGVDEVAGRLITSGQIRPTIIVGIWNKSSDRHSDYFPQKPFEDLQKAYRDSLLKHGERTQGTPLFATDVQSDKYLKFIVEELKPYIDTHFSTLESKEHTFLAGSSMGGLISIYGLCEYPGIFGGAACLSTHWIGDFTFTDNPIPLAFFSYLKMHLPEPTTHRIYFDYGTHTLDSLYEPYQQQMDSILLLKGYTEANWTTIKFEGADHSERSWHKRLHLPLTFLLGADTQ